MALFVPAIAVILENEGGFVDDPVDRGGRTNFGISQRSYPEEDIAALTRSRASYLYRRDWWDRYGYERILDQEVATKIFDLSVNMGPGNAHICAQRALRACHHRVTEDGHMGPVTVGEINAIAPWEFLPAIRSEAAGYYRRRPKELFDRYGKGWLNRAYT